jgi:hypothetical protein
MKIIAFSILAGLALAGCPAKQGNPGPAHASAAADAEPGAGANAVSDANLGKEITVEGWAVNRKNGAQLVGDGFEVWIEDLAGWPEGYYTGGDKGRKVTVKGILAQDHGLPVFVPKKDEPIVQGIAVEEGTDLEKASLRYILKKATWALVE